MKIAVNFSTPRSLECDRLFLGRKTGGYRAADPVLKAQLHDPTTIFKSFGRYPNATQFFRHCAFQSAGDLRGSAELLGDDRLQFGAGEQAGIWLLIVGWLISARVAPWGVEAAGAAVVGILFIRFL